MLRTLPDTPDLQALKSVLYYRLGKPDEAKEAAEKALEGGSLEARAEAMNTLGHQARFRGEDKDAASYFRRAAALWQAQGNRTRHAAALNNLGIAQYWLEEDSEATYQEALEAAGDNSLLRSRILTNLGIEYERRQDFQTAIKTYQEAISLGEAAGVIETVTRLWNNLGWIYHQQGEKPKAHKAYETGLALAQKTGDREMLGIILANMGELTEDFGTWSEALRILSTAGQEATVERIWEELPSDHPFRLRSETKV